MKDGVRVYAQTVLKETQQTFVEHANTRHVYAQGRRFEIKASSSKNDRKNTNELTYC